MNGNGISQESGRLCLAPDRRLAAWWSGISERMRFTFLGSCAIGMVVHLFMFTNKLVNMDDAIHLFSSNEIRGAGIYCGRWFLRYVSDLTSHASMPWVNGPIGIFFLALTACVVVLVLDIRSRTGILLTAASLLTFPTICCTYAYMFTSTPYWIGLWMAVLGVKVTLHRRYGVLWAGLLYAMSMGIYQAYIGVAVALIFVRLWRDLLHCGTSWKGLLRDAGRYLAGGVLGIVFYFVLLKLFLWIKQASLLDRIGISEMGTVGAAAISKQIFLAYAEFVRFFFVDTWGFDTPISWIMRVSHLLIFGLIAWVTMRTAMRKYRMLKNCGTHAGRGDGTAWLYPVMALGMLVLMPLAMNLIRLMVGVDVQVYTLMLPALAMVYPLLIMLVEQTSQETEKSQKTTAVPGKATAVSGGTIQWLVTGTLTVVIWIGYLTTNQAYLKMALVYETTYASLLRTAERIESMEEYVPGETPVAMIHVPRKKPTMDEKPTMDMESPAWYEWHEFLRPAYPILGQFTERYQELSDPQNDFPSLGRFGGVTTLFARDDIFHDMSRHYIGVTFESVDAQRIEVLRETPEFQAMPSFPDRGSIRCIDGVIVIRTRDAGWF